MQDLLSRGRWIRALLLYLLAALLVFCLAPWVGGESISAGQVVRDITGKNAVLSTDTQIFVYQRVPRVLLGFLVGGALAVVGSVLQVILRNALAAPSTLGMTGAGSVGAVIAISIPHLAFSWGPFSSVQLFALLGSGVGLLFIYMLARQKQGISMNTLLLAGVTIGILCSAIIPLIKYLANPDMLVAMDRWMMGGLDVVGYRELAALFPLLVPGVGMLLLQGLNLNHITLGEEMALGHGVDVAAVERISFLAGALATASAVSMVGPIFFVGLIVPHIIRRLSGYDQRIVLPGAFLAGGAFLVLCDIIARTIVAPTEMPVGIITAILGGPFFIILLLRKK